MTDTSKKPQDTLDEHLAKLGYPPTADGDPGTAQVVVGTPPTRPPSNAIDACDEEGAEEARVGESSEKGGMTSTN